MDRLIRTLQEREKELRCLYQIQRLTLASTTPLETVFEQIAQSVGIGWQNPETTSCCIEYFGRRYASPNFSKEAPCLTEPIRMGGRAIGSIVVSDQALSGPEGFLTEERLLLETLSWFLSNFVEWRHLGILGKRLPSSRDSHWQWRERLLNGIVKKFDESKFGFTEIHLGGSTERGEATHGSDIDLYIFHKGTDLEKERLQHWLDGWSQSVAEIARIQTGELFPDGVINVIWLAGELDKARFPQYRQVL
jgi:hypothetical protein